jgi:16S rRNA (cytidine1402-2'-O)-methyltransferase
MMAQAPGRLFLIPTFLSPEHTDVLPLHDLQRIRNLKIFIAENEKSARHFLKLAGIISPQKDLQFYLLNEHTMPEEIPSFLTHLKNGADTGLLSEAGCPGIADPGSQVVRLAHRDGIRVIPLIGPSSITLALMASGMNGQSFSFHGYLPKDSAGRRSKLKEIEREALRKNETQIFIETPYRNERLLDDMFAILETQTMLCIAAGITSPGEFIRTKTVGSWKKDKPMLGKSPAIFLLGR